MELRIEASIKAKIEACYENMCTRLEHKEWKSIEIVENSPSLYRHPNYNEFRTQNLAV